ncbi:hypothetical protein [Streptomyces sp. NWU339]|uniref:hypothetical protein n=1 Tax=Streptomyces sp. NWU339 TaxID=2185284 RepID=UPI0015E8045D|nr:hypothetical protein [Streptomyces sp. NWU339]
MNDDSRERDRPLRYAHTPSCVGLTACAGAPPLRLAGADDDAAVAAEPHVVRGID